MNAAGYLLCYLGIIITVHGLIMILGCAAAARKRGETRRVIRQGRAVIQGTNAMLREAEKMSGRLTGKGK